MPVTGTASFAKALVETLGTVRARYAALFEAAPSLASRRGRLAFTGHADDFRSVDDLDG